MARKDSVGRRQSAESSRGSGRAHGLPAQAGTKSVPWLPLLPALCLLPSAFCLLLASPLQQTPGTGAGQGPPALPSRVDPKAQQLLDRTIHALGGPRFLGFKTLTTKGRIFAIEEGATSGLAPFQSAVEYPDKRRFTYGKSKPVTLINNGDREWELDKYGLTHQLPEQVFRWKVSNRYSLENLIRLRVREPGVLIQDSGVDFVDNVPTRVLEVVGTDRAQVKLHLHQQSLLPVRIDYRVLNPQTREWEEYWDAYGDYQTVQGIQTPMRITRFRDGERVLETFRNTARYDDNYPAGYFEPTG